MKQVADLNEDMRVAQALQLAWAEEDKAKERQMLERALQESKAVHQKLGLGEKKAEPAIIMEMKHTEKMTKDGFYLKDSDDSEEENQDYSDPSDDDSSTEDARERRSAAVNKKTGKAGREPVNKFNVAHNSKAKSLA